MTVTFAPVGVGEFNATIQIALAVDNQPVGQVAVSGVGIEAPQLGVRPNRFSFSFVDGSQPAAEKLFVVNAGGGSLSFQVEFGTQSGGQWLLVAPLEGEATAEDPQVLNVEVDPTALPFGTYLGDIRLTSSASDQSVTLSVAMAISRRRELLAVSQTGLTFVAVAGGGGAPELGFQVLNRGLGMMAWNISITTVSGEGWLSVDPAIGASEALSGSAVDVQVNPRGLGPGAYYGLLEVASPEAAGSPQFVTVVLNLLEENGEPRVIVAPTGLSFVVTPEGAGPAVRQVRVFNLGTRPIAFTVQSQTMVENNWLLPSVARGNARPGESFQVGVEVDPGGLAPGIYDGRLALTLEDESLRFVDVVLVVEAAEAVSLKRPGPAQNGCARTALAPVFRLLGAASPIPSGWPTSVEVDVVDDCGAKMEQGSVVVDFSNISSPSLALGHIGDGLWAGTWNVPNTEQLSMADVTVTAADRGGIIGTRTRALTVDPNAAPPPRVNPGGVGHSASFIPDPLAPGTIVSIFGENLSSEALGGGELATQFPLPTELAGTQITLGGQALPLLFSREDQVNAVFPFELANRLNESLPLLVRRTDLRSLALSEPVIVMGARPGMFTQDASGSGPGSIQDLNFQSVTMANPVGAGDVIIIYSTGLGQVTPAVPTGAAAPGMPLATVTAEVTVTIGGEPAQILFVGLTPGLASLYQINAVVPPGVPAGDAEIVVTVAGQTSTVVTVAVE